MLELLETVNCTFNEARSLVNEERLHSSINMLTPQQAHANARTSETSLEKYYITLLS